MNAERNSRSGRNVRAMDGERGTRPRDEPKRNHKAPELEEYADAGGRAHVALPKTLQIDRSGSLESSVACICRDSEGRLVGGEAKKIRASSPLWPKP